MIRTAASTLALAIVLAWSPGLPAAAQNANAPKSLEEQKEDWQERYRRLLADAARLEYNARESRENYARAQRRNYPRGGTREKFLIDAETAETQLAKVKDQIDAIFVEARQKSIPRNWLWEVDDEGPAWTPPASRSNGGDADDGRNPLYADDDEDHGADDEAAPRDDDGRNPLYRNQGN